MISTDWLQGATPPIPANEEQRLKTLEKYQIPASRSVHDETFDRLASLAAYVCEKPIALINLLSKDKEFKRACYGVKGETTPREVSFCQYTIMQDDIFEVPNALEDYLFCANPNVTESLKLCYYAGAPLKAPDGTYIGSICVIDTKPGTITEEQKEELKTIADEIISRFELIAVKAEPGVGTMFNILIPV